VVQQKSHEAASVARVAGAWRAAAVTRKAGLVDCALTGVVKASAGPVKLAALALAGGQLTLRLAAPPSDGAVAAMKALGLTPTATAAANAPSVADAAAGGVLAPQDFQTSAAACR
jgi:hypothetical protein